MAKAKLRKKNRKKKGKRQVITAERTEMALTFRRSGATYQQIGKELGVTKQSAHTIVKNALEEMAKRIGEGAEAVRELELQRLDRLQLGIWPKAVGGDLKCIDRVLNIMERRGALLGIGPPLINPEDVAQALHARIKLEDMLSKVIEGEAKRVKP